MPRTARSVISASGLLLPHLPGMVVAIGLALTVSLISANEMYRIVTG